MPYNMEPNIQSKVKREFSISNAFRIQIVKTSPIGQSIKKCVIAYPIKRITMKTLI